MYLFPPLSSCRVSRASFARSLTPALLQTAAMADRALPSTEQGMARARCRGVAKCGVIEALVMITTPHQPREHPTVSDVDISAPHILG